MVPKNIFHFNLFLCVWKFFEEIPCQSFDIIYIKNFVYNYYIILSFDTLLFIQSVDPPSPKFCYKENFNFAVTKIFAFYCNLKPSVSALQIDSSIIKFALKVIKTSELFSM